MVKSFLGPALLCGMQHRFCRKEVVRVFATVVEHVRLAKVIIFKKKRRKGYKKKKGIYFIVK